MKEEFNLSEKIFEDGDMLSSDVKEFIKRLKDEVITGNPHSRQMLIKLNLLAGEKLT